MESFGPFALTLAWWVTLFGLVVALLAELQQGHKGGRARQADAYLSSAIRASYAAWALVSGAVILLLQALLSHDFRLQYVASYTSIDLPPFYSFTALWAGQEGSLLLWVWLLLLFAALVARQNQDVNREFLPAVQMVLLSIALFFLYLLIWKTPPFAEVPRPVADGHGMNPLLQNPGMIFHPPTLYLGYVGFSVPFAFGLAAMLKGRLDDQWLKSTRSWTLCAWFFLTLGNLFGMQWAYMELGWGGFWGWDPVENASLMPWLTGTAYLHSVMIQEKRNMLKTWNLFLIIVTFLLTILGTFITRSGLIASVHSFSGSNLGGSFLLFLTTLGLISFGLLLHNRTALKSQNRLDSILSRESTFLFNNIVFLAATFAVLWGTLFPIIAEAVTGTRVTVGAPFFNRVITPMVLMMVLLMAIAPLIAWRRASLGNLKRNFLGPALLALGVGGLLVAGGIRHTASVIALTLASFVVWTMLEDILRGIRTRHNHSQENYLRALLELTTRNRRRYGGYIIHFGMVMIIVGITGATTLQQEKEVVLAPGESIQLGGYTLRYDGLRFFKHGPVQVAQAVLQGTRNGQPIAPVTPEKNFYQQNDQPSTEVFIHSTWKEDLYVILAGYTKNGATASFKILINPLVKWIWTGVWVLLAGTVFCLWPERRRRHPARHQGKRIPVQVAQPKVGAMP